MRGDHAIQLFWRDCAPGEPAHHQCKEKLQRIDVKQHHEQKHCIQDDRVSRLQTIAARENVVVIPDLHQRGKADGEGEKSFHRYHEFFKRVWHFQRNHQQCHGEGKDGVGEAFQSRDLAAAPAEVRLRWDQVRACAFVKHGIIVPWRPPPRAKEFRYQARLPIAPLRRWPGSCPEHWLQCVPCP